MSGWRAFSTVVRWDVAREMRRRSTLAAMAATALVVLFVLSFAVDARRADDPRIRAGLLWVTWILAGAVGAERAFRGGRDAMTDGFLLAPIPRASLFWGRTVSTFLFTTAMSALSIPVFLVLFDASVPSAGLAWLAAVSLLALLGMSALGVLLASMTSSVRGGDVLLRLLMLPVLLPAVAAAVTGTGQLLGGQDPGIRPAALLLAFDLTFLGAGHLLFDHAAEDRT